MNKILDLKESWAGHSFEEVEKFLKRQIAVSSGQFVDLGLPSGTLWASCNLGAKKPEEAGKFYEWGDITGHYLAENHIFKDDVGWDDNNKRFNPGPNNHYADLDAAKITTNIPVNAKYDAAQATIGNSARIPTGGEVVELSIYCEREWVTINSVSGLRLTGQNGNSIFLPAVGLIANDTTPSNTDQGHYWTSEQGSFIQEGRSFIFDSDEIIQLYKKNRSNGLLIRPVMDGNGDFDYEVVEPEEVAQEVGDIENP